MAARTYAFTRSGSRVSIIASDGVGDRNISIPCDIVEKDNGIIQIMESDDIVWSGKYSDVTSINGSTPTTQDTLRTLLTTCFSSLEEDYLQTMVYTLDSIDQKIPPKGAASMAASVPVVLATGTSTFAVTGGCGTGSGLTINTTVTAGALATVAINVAGTSYPVSSTFLLPVSGGTGGNINVTTNSSGVPTSVSIANAGSGYSLATGLSITNNSSGTVAAATYASVSFETSASFTGSILGATKNASNIYTYSAGLGKTLAAIAYVVTTGSIIITTETQS